jgi:hypothetical protein
MNDGMAVGMNVDCSYGDEIKTPTIYALKIMFIPITLSPDIVP